MPTFLDGQLNLAASTVPGVYADIILPQPFLLGLPTNIEGLVGVASWGPLNAQIPVSKPIDAAINIGPPVIRTYDMSTYVSAASQVGGQVGFTCVRVSDGTDVAATGTLQSAATGTVTFTVNPTAAQTLTINAVTISFVASGATGNQVNIGSSLTATLAALMSMLATTQTAGLLACNYSLTNNILTVNANAGGTGGNSFTLATTVTGATASGATLAGGAASAITITGKYTGTLGNQITVSIQNGTKAGSYLAIVSFPGLTPQQFNNVTGAGNAFWVNLAAAINTGNAFSAPSTTVVATAGAATGAPVLSTPVTLSGGTDGASGVTDATLIGQDIVPRKGMFALRSSNVDMFTLCDMSTIANYAAVASFALSETAYAVFSTPSGDTIQDAISIRTNSGIDTPWFKLVLGDYPTFLDSFNGVSRLVNPAAFALGIYGNLSPQLNALNKPLQGISATQRTQLGQTYSEAELSLINTNGLDVIVGPQTSPGGFYFSFGSGRNASSNTAAAGDEYTRMTNFLIRAASSKAAGSFVGQVQSIQPNDQTRANAKALFDGFSQQLASPQFGLGINGQGIIDSPWLVQCDLSNNPPNLQALGFLFLYWTVRYLNVIRYFVVKFQGGGNVTVSVQNTPPSPAQFASSVNTTVTGVGR
jgi:hypothetical protein